MGPLVPYGIIGSEFNYIIALILGFFFGYILENAGFSSSRKLVGVFYGYDFVVLKVFFTAAITAMIGLIFFGYFGWIDLSVVYVNPLFLWPAIVGGAIMGVGFILGGFCPGTSMAAASIGRLDAMIFIVGILFGVWIFGENFGWLESFYTSSNYGSVKIFETLGISQGAFALLIILVALVAFWFTSEIQDRLSDKYAKDLVPNQKAKQGIAVAGILILGVIAAFIPENKKAAFYEVSAEELHETMNDDSRFAEIDKVAFHLINRVQSTNLELIDVRSEEEFNKFSLPGAKNIPLTELSSKQVMNRLLEESEDKKDFKVFYSNDNVLSDKAWMHFKRMGHDNFYVMKGGLNHFVESIFHYDQKRKPTNPVNQQAIFDYRFKKRASEYFQGMEKDIKTSKGTPKQEGKTTIQVSGGC